METTISFLTSKAYMGDDVFKTNGIQISFDKLCKLPQERKVVVAVWSYLDRRPILGFQIL